jgi:hypothetical protein
MVASRIPVSRILIYSGTRYSLIIVKINLLRWSLDTTHLKLIQFCRNVLRNKNLTTKKLKKMYLKVFEIFFEYICICI